MSQARFNGLVSRHTGEINKALKQWQEGKIDADELGDALYDTLLRGHSDTYAEGLKRAGSKFDPLVIQTLAEQHGRSEADNEMHWLESFLDDLEDGRYTRDDDTIDTSAIARRGQMYAHKMRATGNRGFVDGSDAGEQFIWKMTALEHCEDCPRMAALSPYTADELFTVPGGGDTECLTNCKCVLVRVSDNVESFSHPSLAT